MRPSRANKRDANERDIINALEAIGCVVVQLDKPVDLLVGYQARNYLIEVKGARGKLTPEQKYFMRTWKGQVRVVRDAEEALDFILEAYVH